MTMNTQHPWLLAIAIATVNPTTMIGSARAEIVFDGTMGPSGSLSGEMEITDGFGTQRGRNLFHSFSVFNVNTGESATFTSAFPGVTDNVIARVTGGTLSTIDGLLASSIPGADLWLINPSGVVLGENASVSVPGAFHLSTADYLVLEDGGRFDASNPPATVLSMADPTAFGFLGPTAAPLTIDGAMLSLQEGTALSLVGGAVSITDSTISAPASRVNIASVAGPGEVALAADGFAADATQVFGSTTLGNTQLDTSAASSGDIFIRSGAFMMTSSAIAATTTGTDPGDAGGDIVLDADSVTLDTSLIAAATTGIADAGDITLRVADDITMTGTTGFSFGGIASDTLATATGSGGNINIAADNLSLIEGSVVASRTSGAGSGGLIDIDLSGDLYMRSTPGFFDAQVLANVGFGSAPSGDVGSIELTADNITMELGALIQTNTFDGAGGDISIDANSLLMTGASQIAIGTSGAGNSGAAFINVGDIRVSGFQFVPGFGFFVSGIFGNSRGSGNAGDVTIVADSFLLDNFSNLSVQPFSSGDGGSIVVDAADFTVANDAFVGTNGQFGSTGKGGDITIDSERMTIVNGALISAGSFGSGGGGDVTISATEQFIIDGAFTTFDNFTGVFANTFGNGDAGDITVTTPYLEIRDGGFIQSGSFSFFPTAIGDAGDINVFVDDLFIDGGFVEATTWTAGQAGTITVEATGTVTLQNSTGHIFTPGNRPVGALLASAGAVFTSPQATGNAGSIRLTADELIINDGGAIVSETLSAGSGGNIEIDVRTLTAGATDNPFTGVSTSTGVGTGDAGSIDIDAGSIELSGLAFVTAATLGAGNAGSISIDADTLSFTDGGSISALTQGSGDAGTIDINVSGTLSAVGSDDRMPDNITSETATTGDGGTIRVAADSIVLADGAAISAAAAAEGAGGDVVLSGRIVDVSSGSSVSARATGTGNAGTVLVIAVDELIVNDASIVTSSEQSAGGNIELLVGTTLFLRDGATVSAAANGVTPQDDGGNVTIDPVFVILRDSQIIASANAGNGGNILIEAGTFIIDTASVIDASSQTGLDGDVVIDSVNNVYGSVLLLEAPNVEVPALITQRCAARALSARSSLTVETDTRESWSPDDLAPSPVAGSGNRRLTAADNGQHDDDCSVRILVREAGDAD